MLLCLPPPLLRLCEMEFKLHALETRSSCSAWCTRITSPYSVGVRLRNCDKNLLGCFRPLSKTVRFNCLKVIPMGVSDGGIKKVFTQVDNLSRLSKQVLSPSIVNNIACLVRFQLIWKVCLELIWYSWSSRSLKCHLFSHKICMLIIFTVVEMMRLLSSITCRDTPQ